MRRASRKGKDRVLGAAAMGLKVVGRMAASVLALGAVAAAGQAVAQTYTSRVEKVVTYTANGQVQTEADGKNNLTTYDYDGFDRLVKVRYPDPNTPGVSSTTDYEQYGYDATGNRTTLRKRSGETVTFTYDALNRVTYHDGVPTSSYYDNLDRPTWTYAGASNEKINVRYYDALGRITHDYAYLNGTFLPIAYAYDAAGNRVRMSWPDLYVTYDRDNTGAVTAIRENGSTSLATYEYDDLGRNTWIRLGNGASTQRTYDAASRLTELKLYLADPAKRQTYSLTYNAAGQITSRTASNDLYEWAALQDSKTYLVNGLNQYTSAGGLAVGYDARGNTTSNGGSTFGYDLENRLTSASGGATLSYDPVGRLQEIAKPGYQTERLAYDGPNLVTEYDTTNTILRRYVPGPGVDEPLVWYEGSGVTDRRFYLRDLQGSIISVSNNAGAAIKTYTYDEYGVPGGDTEGRFRYTGQTWLPQVGLYHYKARVYSPTLGRFLQTDPIGYDDGLNWYAYVGNDPVNYNDPYGLAVTATTTCAPGGATGGPEDDVVVGACKTTYSGTLDQPPPKVSQPKSTVLAGGDLACKRDTEEVEKTKASIRWRYSGVRTRAGSGDPGRFDDPAALYADLDSLEESKSANDFLVNALKFVGVGSSAHSAAGGKKPLAVSRGLFVATLAGLAGGANSKNLDEQIKATKARIKQLESCNQN